jgi:anti-anti-sigma factor
MPDPHSLAAVPRRDPPFECSCSERGLDAAWVHVTGALDIATTPQLAQTLREAQLQARLVVLDLRELAFMDCAGIHAIVQASSRARRSGGRLLLLRGPAYVDRLFSLTGNSGEVEISDLGPVESPFPSVQRSLVSSSLLMNGGTMNRHRPSH